MEKYEFSRDDYLMYKEFFENRLDKIEVVSKDVVHQKHDKTFKDILKNKKEMSKFLEQFIGLEVREEELEKYKSSFITRNFERRESDIIYKIKGEEVYCLIEHQSSVDKSMPKRILEYCVEIMREIQKSQKEKSEENPLIIPIVIYTGTRKWNVATEFSDTQKVKEKYKKYQIKLKYQLIDINKYSKDELLNKNTKMASMMLIEKYQTSEEIKNILIEILGKTKDKETRLWLRDMVEYVLPDTLKEQKKEIIDIIDRKEVNSMEEWLKRVRRNDARIKRELIKKSKEEGKKENILEIIKRMIKMNLDVEFIKKATGAQEKEIERVKKEICNE